MTLAADLAEIKKQIEADVDKRVEKIRKKGGK